MTTLYPVMMSPPVSVGSDQERIALVPLREKIGADCYPGVKAAMTLSVDESGPSP
jgi:hypothetical protein